MADENEAENEVDPEYDAEEFKAFLDSLVYWLDNSHDIGAAYKLTSATTADVAMYVQDADADPEDREWYVGGAVDPGIRAVWLGTHKFNDDHEPDQLVRVNGTVMSAMGRAVAGWAMGYD